MWVVVDSTPESRPRHVRSTNLPSGHAAGPSSFRWPLASSRYPPVEGLASRDVRPAVAAKRADPVGRRRSARSRDTNPDVPQTVVTPPAGVAPPPPARVETLRAGERRQRAGERWSYAGGGRRGARRRQSGLSRPGRRLAPQVWPGADAGALSQRFSTLKYQSLSFDRCDLRPVAVRPSLRVRSRRRRGERGRSFTAAPPRVVVGRFQPRGRSILDWQRLHSVRLTRHLGRRARHRT